MSTTGHRIQEPPYSGWPSLAERCLALSGVVGERGQAATQGLERRPRAVRIDELLGDLHGDGGLGGDAGCELVGRRIELGRRDHLGDHAPAGGASRRRSARPVRIICLALAGPTTVASRVVMPQPGTVAIPTSGAASFTWSAAILRSQARASSSPPP